MTNLPLHPRPWAQTRSGKLWDLIQPVPDMVDWQDVSRALSHLCRFAGNTTVFYSVAEHSYRVFQVVEHHHPHDPRAQLLALLHDAHEFILGDFTSPVQGAMTHIGFDLQTTDDKLAMADVIHSLKARTDRAIFTAAGLQLDDVFRHGQTVKAADRGVIMAERAHGIVLPPPAAWPTALEFTPPAPVKPIGWDSVTARRMFLQTLRNLLVLVDDNNVERGLTPGDGWDLTDTSKPGLGEYVA